MRKNFILFVLIPLAILLVVVYLFVDSWIESGLETAGETLVGARVEIDDLHTTIVPVSISWKRLQVANPNDPWKNLFETGNVRFEMDAAQLLRNKYIIEKIEVREFILGTKRTTDGSLPAGTASATAGSAFRGLAEQAISDMAEQAPLFDLQRLRKGVNVDSLVKILDIRTVGHIDSLARQVKQSSAQWDAALADIASTEQRLNEMETRIRSINPGELKTVDNIQSALTTVDDARKTIADVSQTFDARKTSITKDFSTISSSVSSIDDIARGDFQRLLSMAKLPSLNTSGIARMLVGKEMYQRATSYLYWVDVARTHIKNSTPDPGFTQPPRLKGQDILFPVPRAYPKLWIKRVFISGGTGHEENPGQIYARGEASNISSNQTLTGSPMIVTLQATEGGIRDLKLRAVIDRTENIPRDEYDVALAGIPISDFQLGKTNFLPTKVTGARLASTVNITVPGKDFDSRTTMNFTGMTMHFESDPRNEVERITRDVLRTITSMKIGLHLWNSGGPFRVALETDLDDQIVARIRDVVGAEFTKQQNALKAKLNGVIDAKRQEFEKLYTARREQVQQTLGRYEAQVNEKRALLDAKRKELTDRLEQIKKGAIDQTLKKIFK
jgi:uncharacterized protein (TIGR03545 family)